MSTRSCQTCQGDLPDGQRFCGRCGADAGISLAIDATATSIEEGSNATLFELDPETSGRFAAGTVIAERYRIVGLLGRGGMGEVYRADDLKLARPVALKFLPGSLEQDPSRLNRLLNEVRTALSVSHPNVCRVHDVHQEAGRHFITMEFVDGDDLSVLLRRIGRLPSDKALQIARQLCAGLGAAHAAGILHRDLKPANIIIDGRGEVKITDFGLAGLAGGFEGAEVRAGTPAYMSPEQLVSKEVTEASDLYALGLVLYEIYTGKTAYGGTTAAQLAKQRSTLPTSPSSHITDIDPAVEQVILRCLEHDPKERPGSALAISAALPGGDPLAAALAAGETPAPELVAEAGAVGGLKPVVAWSFLALYSVLFIATIAGSQRYSQVSRANLPKSGEVLQEKAREILVTLGYDDAPRDSVFDFEYNDSFLRHLNDQEPSTDPWAPLARPQPSGIFFGYRQSPRWISYESAGAVGNWTSRTIQSSPGDIRLRLDPIGRLVWLDAVPPEVLGETSIDQVVWELLFNAAGLDLATFVEVEPTWLPPRGFDRQRAWTGVYPDAPTVAIRVEAASHGGRPIAFRIVEPWSRSLQAASSSLADPTPRGRIGSVLGPLMYILALTVAAFLAWRNVRLRRGDRHTAVRFALTLGALRMVWYLLAKHVAAGHEILVFQSHLAWALQRFGLAYVYYLAFEPYARKLWPRMLTSWVRFFDGRFRDPLVGRDLLVGLTLAAGYSAMAFLMVLLAGRGDSSATTLQVSGMALESLRGFHGAILGWSVLATVQTLDVFMVIMIIFIFRWVFRRDILTLIPMTLLALLFSSDGGMMAMVTGVVLGTTIWIAMFRFGLLAAVVFFLAQGLMMELPLTFNVTAWWAAPTWLMLASWGFVAIWGFRMSLAGLPVFRERLFEN